MRFWLGTHEVSWLARTSVPLFVSRRRLARQKSWRPAVGSWALDSGGFTELSMNHRWTVTPREYAAEVELWAAAIGGLEWCAPMDWMCEPGIVRGTGLSVVEHQERTIDNYLELRALGVEGLVPVVQGWALGDYLRHVEMYDDAGVDLREAGLVGVGSVCRRGQTEEIVAILLELAALGLSLHAFGVKGDALSAIAGVAASSDSMAWSFHARKNPDERRPECEHPGTCANCLGYALWWREEMLGRPPRSFQVPMFTRGEESRCTASA